MQENKTYKKLELDKVLSKIKSRCVSDTGRDMVDELSPMTNSLEIDNCLLETEESVKYLDKVLSSPIRMFDEVESVAKRAQMGAVLHGGNLLRVANFLMVSREVHNAILDEEMELPVLKNYANSLIVDRFTENEIKKCILSEEDVADDASVELFNIRKGIRNKQSQIREKMDSMLRSKALYLQESIITIRGGRYVLPVKAEYKGNVQGIVHDVSSSGSTVFIEPMSVVELNNAIKTMEQEEEKEIVRILKRLSALVNEQAIAIITSYKTLGVLDFIFAKAKYAIETDSTKPIVNMDGYINIVKGRHPLIEAKDVVPIDIWCGKDFQCLIVTGPNTGGKTVSLKTCGLFVLMMQCGLFVPANSGTTLPIMDRIYADIGDEQSIEQSLSTFSSHMKNIVEITGEADSNSMVLLDELGAGTDPTEGAALAISILEHLISLGSLVLATTHYSELKAYAMTKDYVENAAMEFNVETLSPTYHMGIGVPGKSNAFEISRRLGLEEDIIKSARGHIEDDDIRFEDIIQSAERNRKAALKMRKEAEQYHLDAKKLLERSEQDYRKLKNKQDDEIVKAQKKANEIVAEAQQKANDTIKRLKRLENGYQGNLDRERQEINDNLRTSDVDISSGEGLKPNSQVKASDLKLGMTVKLIDNNMLATILKMPNNKGELQVMAGIMKLTTNISNIALTNEKNVSNTAKKSKGGKIKASTAPLELDIRGHSADEGLMSLDLYLDNAYMSRLPSVQIIHGKGTGVLRNAVHRHLKKHPHVKSFRLGKYGEGEDGVTIAELKY